MKCVRILANGGSDGEKVQVRGPSDPSRIFVPDSVRATRISGRPRYTKHRRYLLVNIQALNGVYGKQPIGGHPTFNIIVIMKVQRGFVSGRGLHHINNLSEICVCNISPALRSSVLEPALSGNWFGSINIYCDEIDLKAAGKKPCMLAFSRSEVS
jgi:hypothetical protein